MPNGNRGISKKQWRKIDIFSASRWKCIYCNKEVFFYQERPNTKLPHNMATIDHIIPKSKGGTDKKSNLVCACIECNHASSDMDYFAFYQTRGYVGPRVNNNERPGD